MHAVTRYTTVEEVVKRMEEGYWRRYHSQPDLRAKLAHKTRVVQLALTDGQGYWFHIIDGKLAQVQHGHHPNPDAIVTVSKHDLLALFNGELKAMQAYLTGRVRLKASLGDMLFAKSLIG
jgi:putative sterol carrier protein